MPAPPTGFLVRCDETSNSWQNWVQEFAPQSPEEPAAMIRRSHLEAHRSAVRPLSGLAIVLCAATLGLIGGRFSATATPSLPPAALSAPPPSRSYDLAAGAQQGSTNRPDLATVHVPIINYLGENDWCNASISAQNVGSSDGKVVLVAWGEPGACGLDGKGPRLVECSGILRPGGAWRFAGSQIPTGAKSGVLFSASLRRLSEMGVASGEDKPAADWVCDTLAARTLGDPDEYAAFAIAFEEGEVYQGVPMDQVAGPPLAVTVSRHCPGDRTPGVDVAASYEAAPNAGLGMPDPVSNAYTYLAGPLYVDDPIAPPELPALRTSFMTVQNAGTACASVEIQLLTEGDCGDPRTCDAIAIAPGESAFVDPADCAGVPNWRGTAWIDSNRPLAIEVDSFGADGLSAYTGVPLSPGFAGVPIVAPPVAVDGVATTLFASAIFQSAIFQGAGASAGKVEVVVHNLAEDRGARVRVDFVDQAGATIDTREIAICARGSGRVEHVVAGPEAAAFGSIRAESLPDPAAPGSDPAPISAVAEMRSLEEIAGTTRLASTLAVNLLPEARVFDWPDGGAGGMGTGLANGAALLAWPGAERDPLGWGLAGGLVISNAVPQPGHTDVAVLLYDQNALLAVLCRRLEAGASTSIDFLQTPAVIDGFKGSALVSATAWTHRTAAPAPDKPLVGLTALLVSRQELDWTQNRPGDALGAAAGQPLPPAASPGFEGWRTSVPLCPGEHMPSPRPTAGPDPQPGPPGAGAAEVHVPAVNFIGQDLVCTATIEVTNRGPESAVVTALFWGEPGFVAPQCAGVANAACSTLLDPGDTWRIDADGINTGGVSASFYSFNTRTLGDLGVPPGSSAIAAAGLCQTLRQTLVGQCPAYTPFGLAFRSGSTYAGLPLDRLIGPPIDVTVTRDCEAVDPITVPTQPESSGIPHAETVAIHPGSDPARGTFAYSLSHAVAAHADAVSTIYLQNVGLQPARVSNFFRAAGARESTRLCGITFIAPGETYPFDTTDCFGSDWEGSVVIRADQPLAVQVDELRPDGLRVHGAFGGDNPFDLDGDGKTDQRDLALLDAALGSVPSSPRWNRRYDLIYDDRIDQADRDWLLRHIDGEPGTPPPPGTTAPPPATTAPPPATTAPPPTTPPPSGTPPSSSTPPNPERRIQLPWVYRS
jgi:hypothetical protein